MWDEERKSGRGEIVVIIVSMGGGLGNQMFEYAFYMQLRSLYSRENIKFDTEYAFVKAHNGIEIDKIFGLDVPKADYREVRTLAGEYPFQNEKYNKNRIVARIFRRLGVKKNSLLIQDCFTEFYPKFFDLRAGQSYYMYGPFANVDYFRHVSGQIVEKYKFQKFSDEKNLEYAEKIDKENSVSVHIRRGDYLKYNMNVLPRKYYMNAINYIKERVNNACFFVFSDDIGFARNFFAGYDRVVYVEGNYGKKSYRDMQLMSMCKHNIIANSTFSFWGAYLNANCDKIVVASKIPCSRGNGLIVDEGWICL